MDIEGEVGSPELDGKISSPEITGDASSVEISGTVEETEIEGQVIATVISGDVSSNFGVVTRGGDEIAFNLTTTGKRATIDVSTTGAHELVALIATKKIRVIALYMMAKGTVDVTFKSNLTQITGSSFFVTSTGIVLNEASAGWFETAGGEALNIYLSADIAVSGKLIYEEVTP